MKKSLLLDINSENVFSIVCQWLSENVSIAWCKLLSRESAPPWNTDLPSFYLESPKILYDLTPPLKCTLVQKSEDSFLKKQKILFPAIK